MTDSAAPKSRLRLYVGLPLLILFVSIVGGLIFRGEYTTQQSVERSFSVEMDFEQFSAIMKRTNASKAIVTMGGDSEFVSQRWTEIQLGTSGSDLGKFLIDVVTSGRPKLALDLKGKLQVRTLDEYVGKNVIDLAQEVQVRPDKIESHVVLEKGSERLVNYEMVTRFSRDEEQTKVELTLTQAVKTDAPWFAHGIADRRVRASAARALENQERAIRQLIEENADKTGLFPLK